jgi:hypothetical protein
MVPERFLVELTPQIVSTLCLALMRDFASDDTELSSDDFLAAGQALAVENWQRVASSPVRVRDKNGMLLTVDEFAPMLAGLLAKPEIVPPIRAVRDWSGCGLAHAKEFVDANRNQPNTAQLELALRTWIEDVL